jgi:hypothetical protein
MLPQVRATVAGVVLIPTRTPCDRTPTIRAMPADSQLSDHRDSHVDRDRPEVVNPACGGVTSTEIGLATRHVDPPRSLEPIQ